MSSKFHTTASTECPRHWTGRDSAPATCRQDSMRMTPLLVVSPDTGEAKRFVGHEFSNSKVERDYDGEAAAVRHMALRTEQGLTRERRLGAVSYRLR
jgi:hypothetical protein